MLDEWLFNVSFSSYYNICLPLSCTYQYEDRNHLFVSITTIISIFGGLSLVLKNFYSSLDLNLLIKLIVSLSLIKQIFICQHEKQIIRRLHIILVIGILTVCYMFSVFTPRIITNQTNKPLLEIYQDIFLNLTARFHEIRSSDLINDQWISYLYEKRSADYQYSVYDFYYSAVGQFQLLSSFYNLSNEIVENSIFQFKTRNIPSEHQNEFLFNTPAIYHEHCSGDV
ncbi:hypothetical protein I4U23_027652 [Adineta vaga]|nr:hypothetical protein I4U23_027652 [Adineta vaga]